MIIRPFSSLCEPLYRGSHRDEKGLIITGQDQLNAISGNLLAMENSRFPEIEFEMNGNYSNLDIAPIEFVQPFIASEDTFRNVRIQNEKYEIERMDWFYDAGKGVFKPGINVKHVTTGSAGVTIEIPDVPDDSGFSVPNFQIPTLPSVFAQDGFTAGQSGSVTNIVNEAIASQSLNYAKSTFVGGVGASVSNNGMSIVAGFSAGVYVATFSVTSEGLYWIGLQTTAHCPGDTNSNLTVTIQVNGETLAVGDLGFQFGQSGTNYVPSVSTFTIAYLEIGDVIDGYVTLFGSASNSSTGDYTSLAAFKV